ncbi:alpha/beta fold hydrolase [Kocuria sp. CPCC 205263]|uniref:alpha/beta fold hydrolase n=1 Tax=Kocuria sp. CPCC 205263 TaxID=3073555 RepID=UPI0034D4470E
MKAFVLQKYGSPLRQADVPEPVLGDHEVLVRMKAAGVNHGDERLRTGEFKQIFPFRLPMVVGSEFAGEVVATGSLAHQFEPGMEVFAYADLTRMGAFAELIAIDEKYLALKPSTVTMAEAASLPVNGLTAWNALVEMGQLRAGQTVLIHGGSGGVGSVAIQLAKYLGATVATTVSAANADLVRELGADIVIDYRTEDFAAKLSGVDLVLDSQGGETLKKSLGVLRPGGTVISITGPPDPDFAAQARVNPVVKAAIRALSSGIRRQARRLGVIYHFLFIQPHGDQLRTIAGLVDQGTIRPVVDRTLPFEQTRQALEALLSGGVRGKVLVSTESVAPHDAGGPKGDGLSQALASTWVTAPTQRILAGGQTMAYRELGASGGTPVVMLAHLGATLDNWDPRLMDALARHHRVIAVDLPGVGASSGTVPPTVKGMADAAVGFIEAMRFTEVDLVGFSLGGFIAQQIALDHTGLVRRLTLAGTGPAGGAGINRPTGAAYVYWDMVRGAAARTDAKEFLFFNRDKTGKDAAKAYLQRLDERVMDRDASITTQAFRTQLKVIKAWGRAEPQDLSSVSAPTLVANGDHDRMVPSELSEDLHRRIPDSQLVIYPNAGHGGIFQYWEQFTETMLDHHSPVHR